MTYFLVVSPENDRQVFVLTVGPDDKFPFTPVVGMRLSQDYCEDHSFGPDEDEEEVHLTVAHVFSPATSDSLAAVDREVMRTSLKVNGAYVDHLSLLQEVVEAVASIHSK